MHTQRARNCGQHIVTEVRKKLPCKVAFKTINSAVKSTNHVQLSMHESGGKDVTYKYIVSHENGATLFSTNNNNNTHISMPP